MSFRGRQVGFDGWVRILIFSISVAVVSSVRGESEEVPPVDDSSFRVESVVGRVVWFAEALEKLHDVKSVPEAKDRILAIETADGNLVPLIEDLRARAFRKDNRLRAMDVELLVRRYTTTPALQVLKIFELDDGKKFQLDYWCDVCAILMFESGACACCQDDNRLRRRLVESFSRISDR